MARKWLAEQRGQPSAVAHSRWKVQPSQVPSGHLLGTRASRTWGWLSPKPPSPGQCCVPSGGTRHYSTEDTGVAVPKVRIPSATLPVALRCVRTGAGGLQGCSYPQPGPQLWHPPRHGGTHTQGMGVATPTAKSPRTPPSLCTRTTVPGDTWGAEFRAGSPLPCYHLRPQWRHPPGHSQAAGAWLQRVAAQADGGGPAPAARLRHLAGPVVAPGGGGSARSPVPLPHSWGLGPLPTPPVEEDDVGQLGVGRGEELGGRGDAVQRGARGDTCDGSRVMPCPWCQGSQHPWVPRAPADAERARRLARGWDEDQGEKGALSAHPRRGQPG